MQRVTRAPSNPAERITAAIIAKLEQGVMPWVRPWRSTGASGGPLRSCGKPYRGINRVYLSMMADACGYVSPYWLTRRQALADGGVVRRGERGQIAVFYAQLPPAGIPADSAPSGRGRWFLRSYTVYSAEQCDGLPARYFPDLAVPDALPDASDATAAFFGRIPAFVAHGGDQAFYRPSTDRIQMPRMAAFKSPDHYWTTRAHETVHWSGAPHRLNRNLRNRFGSDAYAAEELIACLGQAILGVELGLPDAHLDDHASYIDSWLRVLKGDDRAIMTAAGKAEEASDYILRLGRPAEAPSPADARERAAEAA